MTNWIHDGPPKIARRTASNDNLPHVVAFTGAAGSGKSTAADYLVSRGYVRVKFAAPLKAMMRAMGLRDEHIEGALKEVPSDILCGRTPRYAMQSIGTEWGRDTIGDEFWTNLWERSACAVLDEGGKVVVDDCRFENEATMVRKLGGRVYGLTGRGGIAGEHSSENGRFLLDGVLVNNWTPRVLHQAIDTMVLAA